MNPNMMPQQPNPHQNPMMTQQQQMAAQQMNTQQQQPPQDQERVRFVAELEFVQCLANPNYICFLAQNGYFKKPEFINYMEYLKYWKKPEYAKLIRYPTCLRFLELVQDKKFREAISVGKHAKEIDDQIILAWTRRHRIRDKRIRTAHEKQEQKQQQSGSNPSASGPNPGQAAPPNTQKS